MAKAQPESLLVKKIQLYLENQVGGLWIKIHGGAYQQSGIADILGVVDGRFVALEVKIPERKERVTKLQARFLEQVRQEGGIAAVVTDHHEALYIVKEGLYG